MAAIHHNTLKRAAAHGLTVQVGEGTDANRFVALKDGAIVAVHDTAKDALEAAIKGGFGVKTQTAPKSPAKPKKARKAIPRRDEDDEDDDEEAGDEDDGEGKSVVKRKYKKKYRPFKQRCGDDLSRELSEFLSVEDEETGEKRVGLQELRVFAKANGVWQPAYSQMNVGMARMNVANRLRGKIRREKHEVKWVK